MKFLSKMSNIQEEMNTYNRSPSIRVKSISNSAASVMHEASSDLNGIQNKIGELNKTSTQKIREQWARSTECLDYLADTTAVNVKKYINEKSIGRIMLSALFIMFVTIMTSCSEFVKSKIEH